MNGSRKPAASPTSSQRAPARRLTRWPSGAAPTMASVRSAVRHASGVLRRRRDRRHDVVGDGRRTASRQLCPPASPEDDADVHASAGDRCDADIAIVEYAHPGIMHARRVRIAEVIRQADARPQARSSPDAGSRGDDRTQAIRADHHIGIQLPRRPVGPPHSQLTDAPGRTRPRSSRGARPRRPPPPSSAARDRAWSDRSRPRARRRSRCRRSAERSSRWASRPAWPGSDARRCAAARR